MRRILGVGLVVLIVVAAVVNIGNKNSWADTEGHFYEGWRTGGPRDQICIVYVEDALELLRSSDKIEIRRDAALALADVDSYYPDYYSRKEIVNTLKQSLWDDNLEVAKAAAYALGEIGSSLAMDSLLKCLRSRDGEIDLTTTIITSLGKIGRNLEKQDKATKLIQELKDYLFFDHSEVRNATAVAFGLINDKWSQVVQPILIAIKLYGASGKMIKTLGRIGHPASVETLLDLLPISDDYNHELFEILAPDEFSYLSEYLRDHGDVNPVRIDDWFKDEFNILEKLNNKVQATRALGMIGDPVAIDPLIKEIKDLSWDLSRDMISFWQEFEARYKEAYEGYDPEDYPPEVLPVDGLQTPTDLIIADISALANMLEKQSHIGSKGATLGFLTFDEYIETFRRITQWCLWRTADKFRSKAKRTEDEEIKDALVKVAEVAEKSNHFIINSKWTEDALIQCLKYAHDKDNRKYAASFLGDLGYFGKGVVSCKVVDALIEAIYADNSDDVEDAAVSSLLKISEKVVDSEPDRAKEIKRNAYIASMNRNIAQLKDPKLETRSEALDSLSFGYLNVNVSKEFYSKLSDKIVDALIHSFSNSNLEYKGAIEEEPWNLAVSEGIVDFFTYQYEKLKNVEVASSTISKLKFYSKKSDKEIIRDWTKETLDAIVEKYPELENANVPLQNTNNSVDPTGDKNDSSNTNTASSSGINDSNINITPPNQPDIFGGVWF